MEVRSSRRLRTLVTRWAVEACPLMRSHADDIHDGPEHHTLQSKAGYIDARPITASSAKSTCNARPDHTSGSFLTGPEPVASPAMSALKAEVNF